MFKFRSGLQDLPTYSIEEKDWDIKLDANESAVNLPPLVQDRIISRLSFLPFNRYPDISTINLRTMIAQEFNVSPACVAIGNGSSGLIEALCYAVGGSGKSIVFPTPSFSMYTIYAKLADSTPVPVELDAKFDLDANQVLAAARDNDASLIILCNPNNPTGNTMPLADIETIAANAKCPVVVDEAYYEFHGETAAGFINKYSNLIIMRTFSKAYGLASARVGYMVANEQITTMVAKVLLPYHINALSLVAAETVYQMRDEFSSIIAGTVAQRELLAGELAKLPGVLTYLSKTNFILIKVNNAAQVASLLAGQSISVRDFKPASGLADYLRITVGTPLENEALIKALKSILVKDAD